MITSMAPNHRKQEGHQAQTEGGLSFVPVCAKCSHVQSKQNKKVSHTFAIRYTWSLSTLQDMRHTMPVARSVLAKTFDLPLDASRSIQWSDDSWFDPPRGRTIGPC